MLSDDDREVGRLLYGEATRANLEMIIADFTVGKWQYPQRDPEVELPLVMLSLPPDGPMNFEDPEFGFPGFWADPAEERVLTLWRDDLMTIRHGTRWRFIIHGTEPFDDWWRDLMFPPPGPSWPVPTRAAVVAHFGPIPPADGPPLEAAAAPATMVNIEDRRPAPAKPERPRQSDQPRRRWWRRSVDS